MRLWVVSILFAISLLAAAGFPQTTSSSEVTAEMRQEADAFYLAADWKNAAEAYEKILKLDASNANAHYRLGNALFNLGRNQDAVPHFEKAFSSAPNSVYALILARAYARVGDKAKAYEVIDKSLKAGGIAPEKLTGEKDFSEWQSDPQFKELVSRSDLAANPCKAKPEYRQFDFWIGEWDVKSSQGQPAGTSSVQLILGQCTIFENWTSGSGSSGKSFNIYDANDNHWHQTWVSDKGVFTHYVGGLEDGKMVIVADGNAGGKRSLARMTFSKLPNGDVRQFGENSNDGKTWTTSFDLIYTRRR